MIYYDTIISAALECVDTKWVHQGRCVGAGIDCVGVIVHVARAVGFACIDVSSYPRRHNGTLEQVLDDQAVRITPGELYIGDIQLIEFSRDACHVSIYIGDDIVHSYAAARRCVRQPYSGRWRTMTKRNYRFRELR